MTKPTTATATKTVKPVPEGYSTVTPFISFSDARKEIEFLKKALGAEERMSMLCPETQKVMHAEVKIGSSIIMVNDTMPGSECGTKSARDLGGTPVGFYLYFQDVDAAFAKATKAGAKTVMPPTEMFWGDRMATVECPEGFKWSIATHTRDLTPEQIQAGQKEFIEQMKAGAK